MCPDMNIGTGKRQICLLSGQSRYDSSGKQYTDISDTAGYIQKRTILGGWGNDVSFGMFLLCMVGNGGTNLAESPIIDE